MYFNPLSLYRERPVLCTSRQYISCISIHSPYTGRDRDVPEYWDDDSISIHSPYTGRDWVIWNRHYPVPRFQSTLPIQGETAPGTAATCWIYFNPLSLYRERRVGDAEPEGKDYFNPLSLYRERPGMAGDVRLTNYFNPLSLYRERPCYLMQGMTRQMISIHSPYTGRDLCGFHLKSSIEISIHSPYTGRDLIPQILS